MAAHELNSDSNWVEMPGPAWWWDQYDMDKYGWTPMKDVSNAKKAFDLVAAEVGGDTPPTDWQLLTTSMKRLECLDPDIALYL